jgi:glycosyltransferase involved in cell wall biosynthesis
MYKEIVDVALLTANYNNAPYLSELIDSVVNSSVWPKEFVIVDDGSTDNSVAIISQYKQKYNFIKLIESDENEGFANALNKGLQQVQSKYIIRVDADDYIDKNRIQIQFRYMEENQEIDVLGSNIKYFDSRDGRIICSSNSPTSEESIYRLLKTASCPIIHGSIIAKASVYKRYRYEQSMVPAEDYYIFAQMAKNDISLANISDALSYVRVHVNSVSNSLKKTTIEKYFTIAHDIFGYIYSEIQVKLRYKHLYHYRMFLFELNPIMRYTHLLLACIYDISKVYRRIFKL